MYYENQPFSNFCEHLCWSKIWVEVIVTEVYLGPLQIFMTLFYGVFKTIFFIYASKLDLISQDIKCWLIFIVILMYPKLFGNRRRKTSERK